MVCVCVRSRVFFSLCIHVDLCCTPLLRNTNHSMRYRSRRLVAASKETWHSPHVLPSAFCFTRPAQDLEKDTVYHSEDAHDKGFEKKNPDVVVHDIAELADRLLRAVLPPRGFANLRWSC